MLPLPAESTYNRGLRAAANSVLQQKFGMPRHSFAQDCRDATVEAFARIVVTEDVGPFRARGPRQAIASLRAVFAEVRRDHPDLHNMLTTAGMLCCRYQRGSSTAISNHSWGTAIDLGVAGPVVPRGSRRAPMGLQLMVPYFNRHGWYWGAAFNTPDPHHFECGTDLVRSFDV